MNDDFIDIGGVGNDKLTVKVRLARTDAACLVGCNECEGWTALDLAGIAKLREALDMAEVAWWSRNGDVDGRDITEWLADVRRELERLRVPWFDVHTSDVCPGHIGIDFHDPELRKTSSSSVSGVMGIPFDGVPPIVERLRLAVDGDTAEAMRTLRNEPRKAKEETPPIHVSTRAEAEVLPPSNCMILDKDKIESIKAELRHLVFASKWGAAEPWPEIRDTRPLPKLGGLKSLAPRYPQLTDWVHAQPEGAVLLAVIHGSERAQPVAEDWILRRKLFICNRCDLANAFVAGVKFDAVWLSREVAPDCESRIPQGVSVYREGT